MELDDSFKALLILDQWDRYEPSQCEEIARQLEQALPTPFHFHAVEPYSLGAQKHHIAVFERVAFSTGSRQGFFALIPGGQTTLGYDREHPFVPNEQQQKSWIQGTQEGEMFTGTLDAFLDIAMTPLRRVNLAPFLLEIEAAYLPRDWRTLQGKISFEETQKRLHQEGLRLPTSDEWEYACSTGSRTLFRWGNETPDISIPHRSQQVVTWDLHLRKNAFGLLIARDPNQWEICAEPGLMRGGDGGVSLCAGAGTFAEWLTLASAFHLRRQREIYNGAGVHLRRTLSLF